MKKIEFYTHPVVGKENKPVNAKYILLSYFLSDHNDVKTITRTISEIEAVKNKQQTFDEVFTDKYGTIPISVSAGIFECDSNTAYLISNNPGLEADVTLLVDELIDILNEWKAFLA
jgi:hypothetical protein